METYGDHVSGGQMAEYWLLERDQKMIMGKGFATHPLALTPTLRRIARIKRGKNKRMV